jgi:polysaccharide chain length determinant protein (PEP-CTERM system associated)
MEAGGDQVSHYVRIIVHRKWWVISVFLVVSAITIIRSYRLPDIYMSETVILVDPQKVPESYVKSTVTGDVRNRLGTLSQQILSATRLQKIIDSLNLYPQERKTLAREDVITRMRSDIGGPNVLSDFGGSLDLQAFRISYSGRDPRLVALVTNQLASLFIEENMKAREQQATGTSEFLQNQLQDTRKALETQEVKLRDFRLKHIGEMPEQQSADLQILGQLQSQLQLDGEALGRAEQQKSYIQSLMSQSAPVVDLDENDPRAPSNASSAVAKPLKPAVRSVSAAQSQLAALLARGYTESHPTIKKLRTEIAQEKQGNEVAVVPEVPAPAVTEPAPIAAPVKRAAVPLNYINPVLQSQLKTVEAEIAKYKLEQQRLQKQITGYQGKLEAIPVREQEITELVRDYEMSKVHYSQLLDKQLSAETATQLEIRQKGEKFEVLDPGQVAERPSSPNRKIINVVGSLVGLALGLVVALATELLGMSITVPQDITAVSGLPVFEVIPIIQTQADKRLRTRWILVAAASTVATLVVVGAILFYHYRGEI